MKRFLKLLLAKVFHVGQHFGVDILPRHFYSEIPLIHRLRTSSHWREPYSLIGVAGTDLDPQLAFVREMVTTDVAQWLQEYDVFRSACERNGAVGYGPVEAEFLYAFVRTKMPARITQVGCGVSTAICLQAAADAGYRPTITCIDPFPTQFLIDTAGQDQIRLVQQPVEHLPLDFLQELTAGDFFFVDATHTLGPGGEVTRIITEMLPRLNEGVFVHFHDIWLPYDFEPALLDERIFFWHETALLMAFLSLNDKFRIRVSLSLLHHGRSKELGTLFIKYRPMKIERGIRTAPGHYPTSIYLEVAKAT